MLNFATEFPVTHAHDARAFLDAVRAWLLGSPHTAFTPADLDALSDCASGDWSASRGHEVIRALHVQAPDDDAAAVGYQRYDGDLK